MKKGVVYSDEDDDGEVRMPGQRRLKRKSTVTSDSEISLRAMMDIDDGLFLPLNVIESWLIKCVEQVDCVSKVNKVYPQREESEESEEEGNEPEKEATVPPATSEDDESDCAPVVPKRRKPRKVVPVGRNGLKKRRVIKSQTTTDAKGYIRTSSRDASRNCCLTLYCRDGRLFVVRVCRGRRGNGVKVKVKGQEKGNEENLRTQGRGGETKGGG